MPEILIRKNLALESLMRAPLSPASRMIAELAIDSVPVVDAEPVRRGWWIRLCDGEYYCSECQAHLGNYRAYCGKCGARMGGGADNA